MSTPLSKTELVINSQYRKRVIELIDASKASIDLLMYEWKWYKDDIACDASLINQALVRALRRGVKIRGVVNSGTQMQVLRDIGFDVRTNDGGTVLHTKCLIFDNATVLLGSHNLTDNAMRSNIETSVIIESEENASQMARYFNSLWQS